MKLIPKERTTKLLNGKVKILKKNYWNLLEGFFPQSQKEGIRKPKFITKKNTGGKRYKTKEPKFFKKIWEKQ